jgi:hypothetical protein
MYKPLVWGGGPSCVQELLGHSQAVVCLGRAVQVDNIKTRAEIAYGFSS